MAIKENKNEIIIHGCCVCNVCCICRTAADVNVYSYRQPELIKPLTDAFTAQTGINVNVAYLQKGMVERMKAEGRRSPADVVLTVDISRLSAVVNEA